MGLVWCVCVCVLYGGCLGVSVGGCVCVSWWWWCGFGVVRVRVWGVISFCCHMHVGPKIGIIYILYIIMDSSQHGENMYNPDFCSTCFVQKIPSVASSNAANYVRSPNYRYPTESVQCEHDITILYNNIFNIKNTLFRSYGTFSLPAYLPYNMYITSARGHGLGSGCVCMILCMPGMNVYVQLLITIPQ